MKIQDQLLLSAAALSRISNPDATATQSKSGGAPQVALGRDNSSVSSLSSAIARAVDGSSEHQARLEAIAKAIDDGSYHVDSHRLAQKIVEDALAGGTGELGQPSGGSDA